MVDLKTLNPFQAWQGHLSPGVQVILKIIRDIVLLALPTILIYLVDTVTSGKALGTFNFWQDTALAVLYILLAATVKYFRAKNMPMLVPIAERAQARDKTLLDSRGVATPDLTVPPLPEEDAMKLDQKLLGEKPGATS
jgi:hypothetical protein